MELDLPPSPPLVEDILAARRAKRLAILAKYSAAADDSPSQSQSPSSAVQPPLPSSSLSDPVTLAPSPSASAGVVADRGAPVLETTVNRVTMNANGSEGQCLCCIDMCIYYAHAPLSCCISLSL